MKKPLFALAVCIAALVSCQKQELMPRELAATTEPETVEKEMGNTKEWRACFLYGADGKPLYDGKVCKGEGNECGRKARCTIPGGRIMEPNAEIYLGLTEQEFVDMWNTDEGMEILLSKGVYVLEE
jgi:hypothetical protein